MRKTEKKLQHKLRPQALNCISQNWKIQFCKLVPQRWAPSVSDRCTLGSACHPSHNLRVQIVPQSCTMVQDLAAFPCRKNRECTYINPLWLPSWGRERPGHDASHAITSFLKTAWYSLKSGAVGQAAEQSRKMHRLEKLIGERLQLLAICFTSIWSGISRLTWTCFLDQQHSCFIVLGTYQWFRA